MHRSATLDRSVLRLFPSLSQLIPIAGVFGSGNSVAQVCVLDFSFLRPLFVLVCSIVIFGLAEGTRLSW